MNAVGIAEQETGRALGFYCSKCGRPHMTLFCQWGVTEAGLVELHRKAEGCCTVTSCPKHECTLYNGEHCPMCILEGPATDGVDWKKQSAVVYEQTIDGRPMVSPDGIHWSPKDADANSKSVENNTEPMRPRRKRARKTAAK